jgi:hypothetical protein
MFGFHVEKNSSLAWNNECKIAIAFGRMMECMFVTCTLRHHYTMLRVALTVACAYALDDAGVA